MSQPPYGNVQIEIEHIKELSKYLANFEMNYARFNNMTYENQLHYQKYFEEIHDKLFKILKDYDFLFDEFEK